MNKALLSLLFFVVQAFPLLANNISYPASSIPAEMKKNADAVVRLYHEEFRVESRAKGVERVHTVVTIFNKNANEKAIMYVPYDQLSKVKKLEGKVYNAFGKEIGKTKRKDIHDMSNYDGFSLFSDNRVKAASLEQNEYPYTVEWIYERETENMMFYPRWAPQDGEKLSVEKAVLSVYMPMGMELRYWENSLAPAGKISLEAGHKVYQWEVHNLPAIQMEPLAPSFRELVPVVFTAPNEFEVAGYAGTMDSWQSYGNWINLLNSSRNDLPVEAVQKARSLTQGLSSDREKIKAIYDYLQGNTRYVSIQLGIGGWQPFKTSFVYEKGYGDCKALSFYTKALLEAVEIPSYYTLIRAGKPKVDVQDEFPMNTFNHVILCVPNEKDTIWLECTSQTNPFGYLGTFTSDRKAVLITEKGGKIVKTPTYQQEENLQQTVAQVRLKAGGSAEVDLTRSYEGLQFENHGLSHQIHLGAEEQRKWVYNALKIPSYEIKDFSFSLDEKNVPVASLSSKLLIRNFANQSGKRTFITLNLANQDEVNYPILAERKSDFEIGIPFIDRDSVIYRLSEGTKVEYLMEDIELESEFGEYRAFARQEGDQIIYTRIFKKNNGRYPAEKYNAYVKFRQEIAKADKGRAVILNP